MPCMNDAIRWPSQKIAAVRPVWSGVRDAGSALGLKGRILLHAGPRKLDPTKLPPPMRNAAVLSCLHEKWAATEREAEDCSLPVQCAWSPRIRIRSPRRWWRWCRRKRRWPKSLTERVGTSLSSAPAGGPQQRFGSRDPAILEKMNFPRNRAWRKVSPNCSMRLSTCSPSRVPRSARATICTTASPVRTAFLFSLLKERKKKMNMQKQRFRPSPRHRSIFSTSGMPACQLMLLAAGRYGGLILSDAAVRERRGHRHPGRGAAGANGSPRPPSPRTGPVHERSAGQPAPAAGDGRQRRDRRIRPGRPGTAPCAEFARRVLAMARAGRRRACAFRARGHASHPGNAVRAGRNRGGEERPLAAAVHRHGFRRMGADCSAGESAPSRWRRSPRRRRNSRDPFLPASPRSPRRRTATPYPSSRAWPIAGSNLYSAFNSCAVPCACDAGISASFSAPSTSVGGRRLPHGNGRPQPAMSSNARCDFALHTPVAALEQRRFHGTGEQRRLERFPRSAAAARHRVEAIHQRRARESHRQRRRQQP